MSSLFADPGRAVWIGIAMFAIALLFMVMFRHGFATRRQRRSQGDAEARKNFLVGLLQFLFIVMMLVGSVAIILIGMMVRSYNNFETRELVTRIHSQQISVTPPRLQVTFLGDIAAKYETNQFEVDGEQWAVEGKILKWSEWLSLFGLQAHYKLTRVCGRRAANQQEPNSEISAFVLSNETSEKMWSWLFDRKEMLPIVRVVEQKSAYTFPDARQVFDLYVTTEGFVVEPESAEETSSRPE